MAKKKGNIKNTERRVRFGSYATEEDIIFCMQTMAAKGLPPIPQEYANFIKSSNGHVRRGVIFYGTNQGEVLDMGNDLVSQNENFAKYHKNLKHCVLLGCVDMDNFLYNTETACYQIVERGYSTPEQEYDTFAEMFADVKKKYKR